MIDNVGLFKRLVMRVCHGGTYHRYHEQYLKRLKHQITHIVLYLAESPILNKSMPEFASGS